MSNILLSSTSPARRALLKRLQIPFDVIDPGVDETPYPNESAMQLVARLAEAKAKAQINLYPDAIFIGCDQVAVINDAIVGKPGDYNNAFKTLLRISNQRVQFYTGLCVYNSKTSATHHHIEPFAVKFRRLDNAMVEAYLKKEQPYGCAGSFHSEGLGIALCDAFEGEDPNALIGLPLIKLVKLLELEGVTVL